MARERRTFVCNACKETFKVDPDWKEKDAKKEYEDIFGEPFPGTEDVAVICDGCNVEFMKWFKAKHVN